MISFRVSACDGGSEVSFRVPWRLPRDLQLSGPAAGRAILRMHLGAAAAACGSMGDPALAAQIRDILRRSGEHDA